MCLFADKQKTLETKKQKGPVTVWKVYGVDKECEKVQDSHILEISDEQKIVVTMLMGNQAAVANVIFGVMKTILTNQDNLRKKLDSLDRKRK